MKRHALVKLLKQFHFLVERRRLELPEQGGGFAFPGSRSQQRSGVNGKSQSTNMSHKLPSVHVFQSASGGNRFDGELGRIDHLEQGSSTRAALKSAFLARCEI